MKKILSKIALFAFITLPTIAFAQTGNIYNQANTFVDSLGKIVKNLIPIVFALGVLGFFWGLVLYIFSQGNEEKKKDGKGIMLWALVALFVMASVWGIIGLAQNAIGIQGGAQPSIQDIRLPVVR